MARNNGSGVVDSKLTEALVGMTGPFSESSGPLTPVAVENFRMLQERQTADGSVAVAEASRVNLLNWDGCGTSDRLMPQSAGRNRK
ncbi:hypothetical protein KHQ06_25520 [Nocardia tengchongensis]|uniref:Uncharacterized protein n=1 Tax=Nocardia tengchongensis TaxID=2055889 RepID=A0ABX8CIE4_9NOCA|nr:hypothetical protein KHQ06_25520 [Nocardia tengchongensis]